MSFANTYRLSIYLTRGLSIISVTALMVLALLTLMDGLLRWLANMPIDGVRDVGALAIAVAVSCCIPVGLIEQTNIALKIAKGRLAKILDFIASGIVAVTILAMAVQFTLYAGKLAVAGEKTWVLELKVAPFWYAVALLFWAAAAIQFIVVLLHFGQCIGRFAFPAPKEISTEI